ncbi:hypothetical protein DFS34DRAFT_496292 [Phlyctochytrium arcticum]|nr:hypothetical protein DFS34DRAFT_496292 [Phlyctochytrium arcticum]
MEGQRVYNGGAASNGNAPSPSIGTTGSDSVTAYTPADIFRDTVVSPSQSGPSSSSHYETSFLDLLGTAGQEDFSGGFAIGGMDMVTMAEDEQKQLDGLLLPESLPVGLTGGQYSQIEGAGHADSMDWQHTLSQSMQGIGNGSSTTAGQQSWLSPAHTPSPAALQNEHLYWPSTNQVSPLLHPSSQSRQPVNSSSSAGTYLHQGGSGGILEQSLRSFSPALAPTARHPSSTCQQQPQQPQAQWPRVSVPHREPLPLQLPRSKNVTHHESISRRRNSSAQYQLNLESPRNAPRHSPGSASSPGIPPLNVAAQQFLLALAQSQLADGQKAMSQEQHQQMLPLLLAAYAQLPGLSSPVVNPQSGTAPQQYSRLPSHLAVIGNSPSLAPRPPQLPAASAALTNSAEVTSGRATLTSPRILPSRRTSVSKGKRPSLSSLNPVNPSSHVSSPISGQPPQSPFLNPAAAATLTTHKIDYITPPHQPYDPAPEPQVPDVTMPKATLAGETSEAISSTRIPSPRSPPATPTPPNPKHPSNTAPSSTSSSSHFSTTKSRLQAALSHPTPSPPPPSTSISSNTASTHSTLSPSIPESSHQPSSESSSNQQLDKDDSKNHTLSEKRRRELLKSGFDELSKLIPKGFFPSQNGNDGTTSTLSSNQLKRPPNRIDTLVAALAYLDCMHRRKDALDQEVQQIQAELAEAKARRDDTRPGMSSFPHSSFHPS